MKRFLFTAVLIAAVIGVMLYFIPKPMQSQVFSYAEYNPVVNVYCRDTSSQNIDLGFGRQVTCAFADYKATLSSCTHVDGISLSFAGTDQDVQAIVNRLNAAEVNCQQLGDTVVACYYSPLIRDCITIDGKVVNVQIAYRNGAVTVGYPLILGAY